MRRRPFRLLVAGGLALAVLAVAVALAGPALVRLAIGTFGRSLGYDVRYAGLVNAGGRLTVVGPAVTSLRGEPVFSADRIELAYSLRDLFGGSYAYGISGVELVRPRLTVIHHRDGSYNLTLPAGKPSSKPFTVPRIRIAVRDGSVGLLDETRIFAHSRRLALEDVQVNANIDPSERSAFSAALVLQETGGRFPIAGHGTLDERRGFELSRITARTIALAPLLDYALNSATLHVAGGVLNSVDARAYALPDRRGTLQRHLSVTANLDHFQPYLGGLTKPLRDGRGAVRVYDAGVTFPKIDGSIAGIPVRIAGAVYDLAHPTVRLGITGRGDVRQLLTLNSAGKSLPVSGPLGFKLLVEGDATEPMILATFASPRLAYGRIPLDRANGLVALHGQEAAVLRGAVGYHGIDGTARGVVLLARHTTVELVGGVTAPTRRVPYAARLLGDMRVHGTVVTTGVDSDLFTRGVVTGAGGGRTVAGTFSVDGAGIGTVGPFTLDGPGRSALYGRVALDRPHFGGGAAFITARGFRFSTEGPEPALPGIAVPVLPGADGTLDASLSATFAGKRFAGAGNATVAGAHVLGFPVEELTARFSAASPAGLALDGRYLGSLEALADSAHTPVAVRGRADVPFSLLASGPADALAQIHDARFSGASIGGVSLDGLEVTARWRGKAVDVYAARARLGGNDLVAQGSFGNGGSLAVSASGVDLAPLRTFGLPVRAGTLSAVATLGDGHRAERPRRHRGGPRDFDRSAVRGPSGLGERNRERAGRPVDPGRRSARSGKGRRRLARRAARRSPHGSPQRGLRVPRPAAASRRRDLSAHRALAATLSGGNARRRRARRGSRRRAAGERASRLT